MNRVKVTMLVMAAVAAVAGPAALACNHEKVQSIVVPAEETTVIQTLPVVVGEPGTCFVGPTKFEVTAQPTTLIRTLPAVVPAPSCEVIEPGSLVIKEQRYAEPVQSTSTRTQLLIVPNGDASGSASSASVDISLKGPNFAQRLANMLDQINLGESRGWLTSDETSMLKSKQASLASEEVAARTDGYSRTEIDNLERELTAFNIEINHEMNDAEGSVAAQPNLMY
ncbi:MAG: hypothetical protein U0105_17895 [Candidatus Obscuribacterales bacterium]